MREPSEDGFGSPELLERLRYMRDLKVNGQPAVIMPELLEELCEGEAYPGSPLSWSPAGMSDWIDGHKEWCHGMDHTLAGRIHRCYAAMVGALLTDHQPRWLRVPASLDLASPRWPVWKAGKRVR